MSMDGRDSLDDGSAEVPAYVRWMRHVAFALIGAGELWLVFGPLMQRGVSLLLDLAKAIEFKASDWVATVAVIVAAIGLWIARRSAKAAERSAEIASKALSIADKAAGSAERAAGAAEKSADADARSAALAEAAFKKENEPRWNIASGQSGSGSCLVRIWFDEGPNEVELNVVISGRVWTKKDEDARRVMGQVFTSARGRRCPGQELHIPIEAGQGGLIDRVKAIVTITAVLAGEDSEVQDPWISKRALPELAAPPMTVRPARGKKMVP